jgi:hypothetical protein
MTVPLNTKHGPKCWCLDCRMKRRKKHMRRSDRHLKGLVWTAAGLSMLGRLR